MIHSIVVVKEVGKYKSLVASIYSVRAREQGSRINVDASTKLLSRVQKYNKALHCYANYLKSQSICKQLGFLIMAKKKNKTANGDESAEASIPPTPAASSSSSTSTPKPKALKAPQPSTSALIICRNKYVTDLSSNMFRKSLALAVACRFALAHSFFTILHKAASKYKAGYTFRSAIHIRSRPQILTYA